MEKAVKFTSVDDKIFKRYVASGKTDEEVDVMFGVMNGFADEWNEIYRNISFVGIEVKEEIKILKGKGKMENRYLKKILIFICFVGVINVITTVRNVKRWKAARVERGRRKNKQDR